MDKFYYYRYLFFIDVIINDAERGEYCLRNTIINPHQ